LLIDKRMKVKERLLLKDEIIELFRSLKVEKEWSFNGYKPSQTGKWTHSYHRYPAKFIPQLVEKLLDEYISGNDAHINDPFMGSGTTIVTAISRGFIASGTDINGISYLMTKVKSTPIEPTYLQTKINSFNLKLGFLDGALNFNTNKEIQPLIPQRHIERINYWFNEDNKRELGIILRIILEEEDKDIRDFLLLAFSHILKNCSIWLQGSTKPTRDFNKKPAKPFTTLKKHLRKMERGNREFHQVISSEVIKNIDYYLRICLGDAKHQQVPSNSVDIIISSSPYVTSYEYADLHQLSTLWLDFANDLKEYRSNFIGSAFKKNNVFLKLKSSIAIETIKKMKKNSEKIAREIETFFLDIQQVFDESYRILKEGGRCCYVIGNTELKGVKIPNAEIFAEIIQYSGFKLDRVIKREIPLKILPQKRDKETGRFASNHNATSQAYPVEYIVIGKKE